jgi:hypothetical protein
MNWFQNFGTTGNGTLPENGNLQFGDLEKLKKPYLTERAETAPSGLLCPQTGTTTSHYDDNTIPRCSHIALFQTPKTTNPRLSLGKSGACVY